MKTISLSAFILLFGLISVSSQDKFTVAEFGYNYAPANKYENSEIESNTGFLSGVLNFPVYSTGNATFLTGFRGNMWSLDYTPDQEWPVNYYSLGLTLTYNQKFSNNNSFLFVLLPKYNSDLLNSSSEAWQLGFLSYYTKRSSDTYLWKAGVYINSEFFGLLVVPVYGLDWDINSRFSIEGLLPIWAKINYNVSEKFDLGFSYLGLISSYRLTGEFNNDYTSRFAIEPALYAEVALMKNIYLKGKLGYTMSRKYPVYDRDDKLDWKLSLIKFGEDRTQLNPVIKNGLFIEFTLAYRIDVSK